MYMHEIQILFKIFYCESKIVSVKEMFWENFKLNYYKIITWITFNNLIK